MKALIAAGGHGTRLRPITYSMNKHLIPVANKPMIYYALEKIAEAGITEVAININEGDDSIEKDVHDGSQFGLHVTYLEQHGGALGVAHIIKNAQEWLGDDSFVFYLGDNIVLGSLKPLVQHFQQSKANAYLALSPVPDPERFGVPVINSNGEITAVIEKPKNPASQYAVTGVYCYDNSVHGAIARQHPSERGELEISDTHTELIRMGKVVKYDIVEGWWKDTGKPKDLLEGNRLLLEQVREQNNAVTVESTVVVRGPVDIHEGVQLLGKTVINGPVSIASGSIIRDSVIGPYAAIGSGTEISGATIENSIVMDEADIECDKKIVDSIIGHNATIAHKRATPSEGHMLMVGENSYLEL